MTKRVNPPKSIWIEVSYSLPNEKKNCWYYYPAPTDDLEKAKKLTETHFKKICSNSGWKNVQIHHIEKQLDKSIPVPKHTTDLSTSRFESGLDRQSDTSTGKGTRKTRKTTGSKRQPRANSGSKAKSVSGTKKAPKRQSSSRKQST